MKNKLQKFLFISKRSGFTLIELMIVVAIIGIIAAVAIPKFADLLKKANESRAKADLGALRSALSIYYTDQAFFPGDLEVALTSGEKYFKQFPVIDIPAVTAQGNPGHFQITNSKNISAPDDDVVAGAFAYNNSNGEGSISINCTHKDAKGSYWSSY